MILVDDRLALEKIKKYHEEFVPLSRTNHIILWYLNHAEECQRNTFRCYRFLNQYHTVSKHRTVRACFGTLLNHDLIEPVGLLDRASIVIGSSNAEFQITEKGKRHLAAVFQWEEIL